MPVKPPNVLVSPGFIRSLDYGDIYFSNDADREVNRVFLEPAKIKQRMRHTTVFSVGEFGFGSGLNFLTTVDAFVQAAPQAARFRFISFEKHPLSSPDLITALSSISLSAISVTEFANAAPTRTNGWHRRFFLDGKVELSVYVGDVAEGMKDLVEQERLGIDAWFLDGFSPPKNPSMWSHKLLQQIALITRSKGTVTSFSASGKVRRALGENFNVQRIDGRPHKRHTLLATLVRGSTIQHKRRTSVRVLGAGIAGCATAFALARKGVAVDLIDPSGLATKASSIPAAILHPRLFSGDSKESRFRTNAYTYAQQLACKTQSAKNTGTVQLPHPRLGQTRLVSIYKKLGPDWAIPLDRRDLREFGVRHDDFAVLFKRSLTIDVSRLCRELLEKYQIQLSTQLEPLFDSELPLVVATSHAPPFIERPKLETAFVKGQVDFFKLPPHAELNSTIVRNGYVTPALNSRVVAVGSTYERSPQAVTVSTIENRDRLKNLFGYSNYRWHSRFRATRTVTSDRFPILGRINSNTWLNLAHGSSGTITGLFGGEHIASEICGELSPFCQELKTVVDPHRFERRQLRRPNPLHNS